ncbi:MAG: type II secretion system F family protein [Bacillota bacterium]|nr:type II secretion system F family protein [Bacillota bacterium]
MLLFFIYGGAFLTVIFLFIGMYNLIFSSRLAIMERLKIHTMPADALQKPETAAKTKGYGGELLRVLGMMGKILSRRRNLKTIQTKLLQAHILMRAEEFIGMIVFCGLGVFVLLYIFTGSFLFSMPCGLLGLKLPSMIIEIKKNRRTAALTQQLPEALSIVSSGLRSGFSFPQAMSVVQKELGVPIGEEFGRVILENRMGKPLEEVLHNLGERNDSDDLKLVITALLIQKQVGGNLAEILDNISQTIRERVRIKGEINTLTAQGKLSALIIILLPVAVAAFLMVMNPDYMLSLVKETIGLIMLGIAVIMQFMGIMIIRKIITIDV